MNEPDFSGIDPLRLPEARRRVAEITTFLQLPARTIADADRHASNLGISRFQLYRLAKVWREHRKPSMLVVSKRGGVSRDYGIPARSIEIANEEIAAAGPSGELATIALTVEMRCAGEGIAPPSRPTLWSYIMKARAEAVAASGPPSVVIGRFWFHLPIAGEGSGELPMVLAAVLLPERVIVAHVISADSANPPSVGDLVDALVGRCTPLATSRPLLLESGDRHAAARSLSLAGLDRVTAHPRSVQRTLARAFGERLGTLKAIYRRSSAKPGKKGVINRLSRPLQAEDAERVIADAIDANNAMHSIVMPEFSIACR